MTPPKLVVRFLGDCLAPWSPTTIIRCPTYFGTQRRAPIDAGEVFFSMAGVSKGLIMRGIFSQKDPGDDPDWSIMWAGTTQLQMIRIVAKVPPLTRE